MAVRRGEGNDAVPKTTVSLRVEEVVYDLFYATVRTLLSEGV